VNTFHVWVRPLGGACRVRVDGVGNAEWLLDRLGRSFDCGSSKPIRDGEGSCCSTFRVPYGSQMSRSTFEELLAAIPEVTLMLDPA
jgi:hypothetical protein